MYTFYRYAYCASVAYYCLDCCVCTPHFLSEMMKKTRRERASERGSERTQLHQKQKQHQQQQKQQNRNTTVGCEHRTQQKQKQQNRNNTQYMIIIYIHPLPFRSIAVCIGVRTAILHRCSHLAFISPAGIGARTLPFTVRWSYRLVLFRVVFNCPTSLHHGRPSCRHHRDGR